MTAVCRDEMEVGRWVRKKDVLPGTPCHPVVSNKQQPRIRPQQGLQVVSSPMGPGPSTNPPATDKSMPEACVGKIGIHKVNRLAHLMSRHTIPPR